MILIKESASPTIEDCKHDSQWLLLLLQHNKQLFSHYLKDSELLGATQQLFFALNGRANSMVPKPNLISDLINIYYTVYISNSRKTVNLSQVTTVMTYIQSPEINNQMPYFSTTHRETQVLTYIFAGWYFVPNNKYPYSGNVMLSVPYYQS